LVIVGPSGAGKGTLIPKLLEKYRENFKFSVSYTTRKPRPGEVDGVHYFFVDVETFQAKIANDDFIEWCQVHNNFYGTSKDQLRKMRENKQIPILDIDIQGAKKVFAAFPETNFIFVCPPSIEDLHSRLMKRNTDSEDAIKIRLKNAVSEINEIIELWKMIQFRVLNKDLARAT
jgi:guanylate kinase